MTETDRIATMWGNMMDEQRNAEKNVYDLWQQESDDMDEFYEADRPAEIRARAEYWQQSYEMLRDRIDEIHTRLFPDYDLDDDAAEESIMLSALDRIEKRTNRLQVDLGWANQQLLAGLNDERDANDMPLDARATIEDQQREIDALTERLGYRLAERDRYRYALEWYEKADPEEFDLDCGKRASNVLSGRGTDEH